MTAPSAPGTVPPRKWGGPELTGIRGVRLSLAHLTTRCTSSVLAGLTTAAGVFWASPPEYSSKAAGSSQMFSLPTMLTRSFLTMLGLPVTVRNVTA